MTQRPLYRDLADKVLVRDPKGNAGLWYDKFCGEWHPDPAKPGPRYAWMLDSYKPPHQQDEINPKLDWIETLTQIGKIGELELIQQAVRRMDDLLLAHSGTALYVKTTERFVTGLGREHPIENGFAWHQTLGTPYLPGSSVKGLVREWAGQWLGHDEEEIARILGPESGVQMTGRGVGSVVFLDALPIGPVQLLPEVMTPHCAPYYSDPEHEDPGDWHSPVPIPFLAVAQGQPFLFGVMPRRPGNSQDCADCTSAAGWLKAALQELGAGAKTAVGFGRFEFDAEAKKDGEARRAATKLADAQRKDAAEALAAAQARHQQEIAGLSPTAGEFVSECNRLHWQDNKDAFLSRKAVDAWLDRLETTPDADTVAKLSELMERHFKGVLNDPDRLKGKTPEPAYKPRPRALAKRLIALRESMPSTDELV